MHACPHCQTEVPDERLLGDGEMAKCPGCDKLHTVPKQTLPVVWVEENYQFLTVGSGSAQVLAPPLFGILGFFVGGIVMLLLNSASGRHNQIPDSIDYLFMTIPFFFIPPGYLFGKWILVRDKAAIEALPAGPDIKRFRVGEGKFWIPTVMVTSGEWRSWMLQKRYGGVWIPMANIIEAKRHTVVQRQQHSTQVSRRITLTLSKHWASTLPEQPPKPWFELTPPTQLALWIYELPDEKQDQILDHLRTSPQTRVVVE